MCLQRLSITELQLELTGDANASLRSELERLLESLRQVDISPLVVFDGLHLLHSIESEGDAALAAKQERAWSAAQSTKSKSEPPKAQAPHYSVQSLHLLYSLLQELCGKKGVPWLVAPYAANAQLAYLVETEPSYVDAVYASPSALLYGIRTVITSLQPREGIFQWLGRQDCLDQLGHIPYSGFMNACILAGSSYISAFPPIRDSSDEANPDLRSVINFMQPFQYDVSTACDHFREDPQLSAENYFDTYQKSRVALQFAPATVAGGSVECSNKSSSPDDMTTILGDRLPDELLFYLQKGMVRANVLDALISHETQHRSLPRDDDHLPYHTVLRQAHSTLLAQAITVICQPLHRYFRFRGVEIKGTGSDQPITIMPRDNFETIQECTNGWNVPQSVMDKFCGKLPASSGSLSYCIRAIAKKDFLSHSKTIRVAEDLLKGKDEVVANVLWRFLHVRGYLDPEHKLTKWGKALVSAVAALNPDDHLEEAVLLGIELTRTGLLSGKINTRDSSEQQGTGSKEERIATTLLSHVGSLIRAQDHSNGIPESRYRGLVAFHRASMTVRSSLRDLMEMLLAALLLNGDAERQRRTDWTELGTR